MDKEALHSHTGLTAADVELVYEPSKGRLLALAAQQRHRNINAPPHTSHNLLVITLHWLRTQPSYKELARLYGNSEHYWHSMVRRVIPVLDECCYSVFVPPLAADALYLPSSPMSESSSIAPSFLSPRTHSSAATKSPTKAAWKYEIACDFSHRIISCSEGIHGGQHDMHIIRQSGLLDQSSPTALIMGDKGYKGKLGIVVPASKKAKVSREVKQLEDEKKRGHELQHERAAIENINQRVKQWAVATEVWTGTRDPHPFFDQVMRVVCALVNVILRTHPLRAGRHARVDEGSVS